MIILRSHLLTGHLPCLQGTGREDTDRDPRARLQPVRILPGQSPAPFRIGGCSSLKTLGSSQPSQSSFWWSPGFAIPHARAHGSPSRNTTRSSRDHGACPSQCAPSTRSAASRHSKLGWIAASSRLPTSSTISRCVGWRDSRDSTHREPRSSISTHLKTSSGPEKSPHEGDSFTPRCASGVNLRVRYSTSSDAP